MGLSVLSLCFWKRTAPKPTPEASVSEQTPFQNLGTPVTVPQSSSASTHQRLFGRAASTQRGHSSSSARTGVGHCGKTRDESPVVGGKTQKRSEGWEIGRPGKGLHSLYFLGINAWLRHNVSQVLNTLLGKATLR